jgi:hypothetical protein
VQLLPARFLQSRQAIRRPRHKQPHGGGIGSTSVTFALVRGGLVTTERENLKGGQSIGRVRITEAGRTGARRLLNPIRMVGEALYRPSRYWVRTAARSSYLSERRMR